MIGSWAARIPAVQHQAGLTNAGLGLALFAASLGALVAMPVAGVAVRARRQPQHHGRRRSCSAASLVARLPRDRPRGLSPLRSSASAQVRRDQRRGERPGRRARARLRTAILSSFHAAFSAGGLVGAGLGRSPPRAGLGPASTSSRSRSSRRCSRSSAARYLLPPEAGPRRAAGDHRASAAGDPRARRGGVLHACSPRALRPTGAPSTSRTRWALRPASRRSRYTAFALMMVASRATGDRLNRRLGPVTLARYGWRRGDDRARAALLAGSGPSRSSASPPWERASASSMPVLFRAAAVDLGRLGRRRPRRRLDDRLVRLPRRPARDRLRRLRGRPAGRARDRRSRDVDPCGSRGQRRSRAGGRNGFGRPPVRRACSVSYCRRRCLRAPARWRESGSRSPSASPRRPARCTSRSGPRIHASLVDYSR